MQVESRRRPTGRARRPRARCPGSGCAAARRTPRRRTAPGRRPRGPPRRSRRRPPGGPRRRSRGRSVSLRTLNRSMSIISTPTASPADGAGPGGRRTRRSSAGSGGRSGRRSRRCASAARCEWPATRAADASTAAPVSSRRCRGRPGVRRSDATGRSRRSRASSTVSGAASVSDQAVDLRAPARAIRSAIRWRSASWPDRRPGAAAGRPPGRRAATARRAAMSRSVRGRADRRPRRRRPGRARAPRSGWRPVRARRVGSVRRPGPRGRRSAAAWSSRARPAAR